MIILYPTETIYALGVNAFSEKMVKELFKLKGRVLEKSISLLVRNLSDIEHYAYLETKAKALSENFLPGPLTLVLMARDNFPRHLVADDGTIGFRISSDKIAQKIIKEFMEKYNSPLTCTSANISGETTPSTVPEILKQFGNRANLIHKIYNDGSRSGASSTIVRVVKDKVDILRVGAISEAEIYSVLDKGFKVQS